jgi:ribosome-associated toxin RatA of RatAB toxin-antitoxin module
MVEPRRDSHPWRALALSAAFGLAAGAAAAQEISVATLRRGEAVAVVCRARLEAPPELVWRTLTDYDRLADFIPGMHRSRVIERRGGTAIVEQAGEARFLFIRYPIDVTFSTVERPPYVIEATMLKGNLKQLRGVYRIEPLRGGGVQLSWTGTVEALEMPPLLGELLMRAGIADQFRGMVREIERRDALWRGQEREPGR